MSNIEQLIKELRFDIKKDSEESLNRAEERITQRINQNIDVKFGAILQDIESIKTENLEQNKRILEIEKQMRYRNIIFFGIEENDRSYEELENKIIQIINTDLKTDCNKNEIEMARRMGKRTTGKIRPIVVTLTTYGKKNSIYKNKHLLKNNNVYIKEDYPKQILEKRRELQHQVQQERDNGKIAYLKYDRLIVRGANNSTESQNKEYIYNNKNDKKRALYKTPPQQSGTSHSYNHDAGTQGQATKKTKISTNKKPIEKQVSLTKFFPKPNSSCNSGQSSDELQE